MITGTRVYFKACRTCRGDMALDQDRYGYYLQCLQCARMEDLPQLRVSRVAQGAK